jgi:hypothetical protein
MFLFPLSISHGTGHSSASARSADTVPQGRVERVSSGGSGQARDPPIAQLDDDPLAVASLRHVHGDEATAHRSRHGRIAGERNRTFAFIGDAW